MCEESKPKPKFIQFFEWLTESHSTLDVDN